MPASSPIIKSFKKHFLRESLDYIYPLLSLEGLLRLTSPSHSSETRTPLIRLPQHPIPLWDNGLPSPDASDEAPGLIHILAQVCRVPILVEGINSEEPRAWVIDYRNRNVSGEAGPEPAPKPPYPPITLPAYLFKPLGLTLNKKAVYTLRDAPLGL